VDLVSGFPSANSLSLRRASRPPSLPSVEPSSLRLPLLLWLFRRPGVRLAPSACTLRSVRLSRLSRLASVALNPGFLRLALPTLIGRSVLRPCAFDQLPASVCHQSSELAYGQLPACAFFWVRLLLQRFITDLLLVHQLDRHYGSPTCARKYKSCLLCG
jgi:hypothetical protein